MHLEKEEQTKPKVGRGKEITKIRAERNETDEETIEKIHETKSCFFEKINKIKKKMKRDQINKTRNEKEVTVYPTEIQTTTKDYFKANKRKNPDETDKCFERYNLPRLSWKK